MAIGKYLIAAVVAASSVPAAGSIVSVGSSSARLCYEAADSRLTPRHADLERCNVALTEGLTREDIIATHVNRGIILMRMGNLERAIDDYDTAMRWDPNEPEAYLNKGAALMKQDDPEAALRHFSIAIERKTRRPALAHYGLAIANEALGNVRQAYLNYRRASELAPEWEDPATELRRFQVVARQNG